MMMPRCSFGLLGCAILMSAACTSIGEVRDKSFAVDQAYESPREFVQEAARNGLKKSGFSVEDERQVDERRTTIIGLLPAGWQSHGEWARFDIERVSDCQSKVGITNYRKVSANVTENLEAMMAVIRRNFEDQIDLLRLEHKAEIVRRCRK